MQSFTFGLTCACLTAASLFAAGPIPPFPPDPQQALERTCFQTGQGWSEMGNLRSDVAIVYGIDARLPQRIQTWRDRGYRIHVMTGVSWGQYQDYLYGRFDGVNHEDEAQTERSGNKVSHGGDVYYMCPGDEFREVPVRGGATRARRRRRGDSSRGTGVLGAQRLFRRLQTRVEEILRRSLAAAAQIGRCPMARFEIEVLSLPARAAAGV